MSVTIAGEPFASYMGVPGIEAEHVTLVLENASPRTEIQLLRYRHPEPLPDPHIRDLNKLGMNHICFVVGDIEADPAQIRHVGFRPGVAGLLVHGAVGAQEVSGDETRRNAARARAGDEDVGVVLADAALERKSFRRRRA